MMYKLSLVAVLATLISGCSVGAHNLSKGVCRDVQVCDGGQCGRHVDNMTQSHCSMVGGTFEPVNHQDGWFNF